MVGITYALSNLVPLYACHSTPFRPAGISSVVAEREGVTAPQICLSLQYWHSATDGRISIIPRCQNSLDGASMRGYTNG